MNVIFYHLINQENPEMKNMDLTLETLDVIEAPLTDMEWGIAAGVAFGAGVWIAVAILT